MGATRFRRVRSFAAFAASAAFVVTFVATSVMLPFGATAEAPLKDAPIVWYERDDANIAEPREREPNLLWDGPVESVIRPTGRITKPSRLLRHASVPFGGNHVRRAVNINALGEVPNSTWFTNRIGLFEMSPQRAAIGSGSHEGPDRGGKWMVVGAKTEGVTPGFNIRDASGDVYLIKFDPMAFPGMASGAGVISNRILFAAGYNVPQDAVVYFTRDMLQLGDDVKIKLPDGSKRVMTVQDLDGILADVRSVDGRWRAISSKFLSGKPVGPFNYIGRRKDDPNDRIDHEHRRELRGLLTIAAWIAHFDTKQHNSLDMYVEEGGRGFVRHHLIDFASTLGTGASGPTYRYGYEYTIDLLPAFGRAVALGLHEDDWRKLSRTDGIDELGTLDVELFDPREFKPLQPNPAFANQTSADAYWAAKVVSAFTDEHLEAICEQAKYENPAAAQHMARVLAGRRDKIARCWFDKIPPLDFFRYESGTVSFSDLGAERNIYPGTTARYRIRTANVDENRSADEWAEWKESSETLIPVPPAGDDARTFVAVECQVDRGQGWSASVTAYIARASGRVIAVDR